MKLNKLTVAIGAASVMMLGISQAQAFDRTHWSWDLYANTDIDLDMEVDVDFDDPSGMTVVEIDQDFDGSITSESIVKNINNMAKPDTDIEFDWEAEGHVGPFNAQIDGTANLNIDNSSWGLGELGAIESTATAVGNNASLTSDVMTNLDALQDWDGSGEIMATSYVANIKNMTVDSAATAVGNNMSLDLSPATDTDSLLLANIVQTGDGDVSAYSTVDNVTLSVGAPGSFTSPHIGSVATAVGNNVNVSVGNL